MDAASVALCVVLFAIVVPAKSQLTSWIVL